MSYIQAIQQDYLYSAPAISAGTLTIDLRQSNTFKVASNANITTFAITGAVAGRVNKFMLKLTANGTGYTQNWDPVVWPSSIAPTLSTTNGAKDWLSFVSDDGGTTWYGFVNGQNFP